MVLVRVGGFEERVVFDVVSVFADISKKLLWACEVSEKQGYGFVSTCVPHSDTQSWEESHEQCGKQVIKSRYLQV